MIRHPLNQNLSIHYESTYLGLPIQVEKGPFIREYLHRLYQTTEVPDCKEEFGDFRL